MASRLVLLVHLRRRVRHGVAQAQESVGGPARLRVIALLASVLALNTADGATVGSVAAKLEPAMHINNTDIGLLVAVTTGIGALATLPTGVLADRVNRTKLLWISILVWSAAMIASGLSVSFGMLLLSRLALGVVIATAGPVATSLTGDYFAGAERGQVWSYILTGELLGTGIGFLVSGNLASIASWRAGFIWLAAPGLGLAWAIRRYLPEPARGGQSHLHQRRPKRRLRQAGVAPRGRLVLHEDPARRSLWWAVHYVLAIRTNRILILASALGYYFKQGLQTFAVLFLRSRFGLGQSVATTLLVVLGGGAILGVLLSGQVGDRLIRRGHLNARPVIGGVAVLIAVVLFVPALLVPSLAVAAPLFFLGAAGLGGANPPLDAARLDIMHSRLWGRAEAVRTVVRTALEAAAPLVFGYVSTAFGGQGAGVAQTGASTSGTSGPHGTAALDDTFLIMLAPVLAAGLLLLVRARVTYPRDLATAAASEQAAERENSRA